MEQYHKYKFVQYVIITILLLIYHQSTHLMPLCVLFLHCSWLSDGKLYSYELFSLAINLQQGNDCGISAITGFMRTLSYYKQLWRYCTVCQLCSLVNWVAWWLCYLSPAANISAYELLRRNTLKRTTEQDYSQEDYRNQIHVIVIIFNHSDSYFCDILGSWRY